MVQGTEHNSSQRQADWQWNYGTNLKLALDIGSQWAHTASLQTCSFWVPGSCEIIIVVEIFDEDRSRVCCDITEINLNFTGREMLLSKPGIK